MLSITKNATINDLDRLLKKAVESNENVVRLPVELAYGGAMGFHGAIFQFLAAWRRHCEKVGVKPTLKIYGTGIDAGHKFWRQSYGVAALYFCDVIFEGVEQSIELRKARERALPYFEAIRAGDFRSTMSARGAQVVSFANTRNEYPAALYSHSEENQLQVGSHFETLIYQLIKASAPEVLSKIHSNDFAAIGTLIFELFKNTDQHACTDENGDPYIRGARGIYVRYWAIDAATSRFLFGADSPEANTFLENQRQLFSSASKEQQTWPILELGVMDTGPGMARRWLSAKHSDLYKKGYDRETEMDALRDCFALHSTTKSESNSGVGLTAVVDVLAKLKAFMVLRTGRLCVFQDFSLSTSSSVYSPTETMASMQTLPETAGASFTLCIPVRGMLS